MADKILATLTSKGQITVPAATSQGVGSQAGRPDRLRSAGRKIGSHRAAAEAKHL